MTIIDREGGFTASTAAEALVGAGWAVRIITDLPYVAAKVDPTQVWFVRRRLKKAGADLQGQVELIRDPEGWALLDLESDDRHAIAAPDLIVLAGARSARDDLFRALAEVLPHTPVHRVEDALALRGLRRGRRRGSRRRCPGRSGQGGRSRVADDPSAGLRGSGGQSRLNSHRPPVWCPCRRTRARRGDMASDDSPSKDRDGGWSTRGRLMLRHADWRADWRKQGTDPDYRYSLANERTFLAWIRTALSLIAAAVAVVQLIPPFKINGSRTFLGSILAAAGLACAAASYLRWSANERAMRQSQSLPLPRGLIWLSSALVVVGIAVFVLVIFAPK